MQKGVLTAAGSTIEKGNNLKIKIKFKLATWSLTIPDTLLKVICLSQRMEQLAQQRLVHREAPSSIALNSEALTGNGFNLGLRIGSLLIVQHGPLPAVNESDLRTMLHAKIKCRFQSLFALIQIYTVEIN